MINRHELGSYLTGISASSRGYLSAPVFTCFGELGGLFLGSTSALTTAFSVGECLDSSTEQKYARILGIDHIMMRYGQGFVLLIL